jgi:hypothetical protein
MLRGRPKKPRWSQQRRSCEDAHLIWLLEDECVRWQPWQLLRSARWQGQRQRTGSEQGRQHFLWPDETAGALLVASRDCLPCVRVHVG